MLHTHNTCLLNVVPDLGTSIVYPTLFVPTTEQVTSQCTVKLR